MQRHRLVIICKWLEDHILFFCSLVLNARTDHIKFVGFVRFVGGGEVEVVSRRSGSGSDYDQWKLSVKSEIHTPLPDETSTDETTPKPDEPPPRL